MTTCVVLPLLLYYSVTIVLKRKNNKSRQICMIEIMLPMVRMSHWQDEEKIKYLMILAWLH